jgi:uncharacterized protein (DUF362 family)
MPDVVFSVIKPKDHVVLKPNWVFDSHKNHKDHWEYIITHGEVITAVLQKVMKQLQRNGNISILDGPQTDCSFAKLISRYDTDLWKRLAQEAGIELQIIDLRDSEWKTHRDVVVERTALPGDPSGKVVFNLENSESEFWGHRKSETGYYGADYNRAETNTAHDGMSNIYSVSRTVIESDVFINIPKLKTHRKAGITACLKNLVGINTYKNYLPHHSAGGPLEGGDQFPTDSIKSKVEGSLTTAVKKHIFNNPYLAKRLSRINDLGKRIFGKTGHVIRSGNWHGNDTIWRMILDLNKILFYGNPDGTMREDAWPSAKKYIGIVDAVLAGEGFGPLEPDPVEMGYLICGTNPVAIDSVCAALMGFDYSRIPSIANAFRVAHYNFCPFTPEDIEILIDGAVYALETIPAERIFTFEASLGWKGRIEKRRPGEAA